MVKITTTTTLLATDPRKAVIAPDHYRVPEFSDEFRMKDWRTFTEGRSKLYRVGDVVWIKRDDKAVRGLVVGVGYIEHHVAYRFIERYKVRFATRDGRWSENNRYIMPGEIRDGYEMWAANKLSMGETYGTIHAE